MSPQITGAPPTPVRSACRILSTQTSTPALAMPEIGASGSASRVSAASLRQTSRHRALGHPAKRDRGQAIKPAATTNRAMIAREPELLNGPVHRRRVAVQTLQIVP